MEKYQRLGEYLTEQQDDCCTLPFITIEEIIGGSLPRSARTHRAWWANDETHPQAQSWMRAGWVSSFAHHARWVLALRGNEPPMISSIVMNGSVQQSSCCSVRYSPRLVLQSQVGRTPRPKASVHVYYTCRLVVLYSVPVNAGRRPTRAKGRRRKKRVSRSRLRWKRAARGKTVIVLEQRDR